MKWINLDGVWHLIASTGIVGNDYRVVTVCKMHRKWDNTGLDALPGGDEIVCEKCVPVSSGVEVEPKPKKRAKKG